MQISQLPYFLRSPFSRYFLLTILSTNVIVAKSDDVYRVNPGDKLDISVWQEENLKAEVVVQPDGSLSFPLVGTLQASGKSTEELVSALKQRLTKFVPEPEISVRLINAEGNMIYVTGEVTHPGAFVMKRPTDVMQAISMAGGLTTYAKKNSIVILRRETDGRSKAFPFEYGDVADGDNIETNILLRSGDTVVVP